jgi:hypothetical protein
MADALNDEQCCRDLYSVISDPTVQTSSVENFDITKVKKIVMPFLESVEEARNKVQESTLDSIGCDLDAENEQENADLEDEELLQHPEHNLLDPDEFQRYDDTIEHSEAYRKLDLVELDKLLIETRKLDKEQRFIVDKVLKYVKEIKKFSSGKSNIPKQLLYIVQGGAGAGKSTVINIMSQWCERILRKSGDNPNQPYIIKATFTGSAACLIDGQTLHSAFAFSFGNKMYSLGDKDRDKKRVLLRNLKLVIIDEMSMVKADMLYQLDFRLKEITQKHNEDFGGVGIILLGDLLQLQPTQG